MAVSGGVTFPVGVDDDAAPATVSGAYLIGETETTWQLWRAVRSWALSHGYNIDAGTMGYLGYDTGENTYPLNSQHPVTNIGWYSSVVWCNALTEMVNSETGSHLTCVYTYEGRPVRSSGETTLLYSLVLAPHTGSGFRLPDNMEWELAARWRGDDATNTVPGYTNPHFTKGDSASGATKCWFDLDTDTQRYAINGIDSTAPVKSKLPNALGLYDMSGNIAEYCDGQNDWNTPDTAVIRGGRWGANLDGVAIGRQKTDSGLSHVGPSMGFRLAVNR
jgi:formylglycine-generating enzyme required for sulfatase activity